MRPIRVYLMPGIARYPCRKFCLQIGLIPWPLDEDVEYPIKVGVLSVVFVSLEGKSHCWLAAFVAHQRQYVRVICIKRECFGRPYRIISFLIEW